ncbi:MAG: FkbM family methyltransferase [Anaeromyxobacter sp.]
MNDGLPTNARHEEARVAAVQFLRARSSATSTEKRHDHLLPPRHERRGRAERGAHQPLLRGFTIDRGEHWLDLGANIGAFALHCQLRGATADCYEPDPDCFTLLAKNAAGFALHQCAVSDRDERALLFHKSTNPLNHWRATMLDVPGLATHPFGALPNMHARDLGGAYDGIKMDIEGAEAGLLDGDLLPDAEKLVFEYHFSRLGRELLPFHQRMKRLRRRYEHVWYDPVLEMDPADEFGMYGPKHDPLVFAWGLRPRTY